jgi:glycerate dehydrogenase
MKIVVLDGHTVNPGDLDWAPLQEIGHCVIFERTEDQYILPRSASSDIVLTNKTPLSAEIIRALPSLRYIGVFATGYDIVDVRAAAALKIPVTNVPGYATDSVAQLVFAHLLHFAQNVGEHAEGVRRGRWSASNDFCYWETPLMELAGKTMGIIGFGRIGKRTATLAHSFGMKVLYCDPSPAPDDAVTGVENVSLEELFGRSDVVSLHCPLTDATRNIVTRQRLESMKPTAYLINTSRGPLVDEEALAEALKSGTIAGAGLDVLPEEPPPSTSPLLKEARCFITPHVAWATREARERLIQGVVENIRAFLQGTPQNVVNGVG